LKHAIVTDWERVAAVGIAVGVLSLLVAVTGFVTPAIGASPLADTADTEPSVHSVGVEQRVEVTVLEDTAAYDAGEELTNDGVYPLANTTPPTVVGSAEGQQARITNLSLVLTYTVAPPEEPDTPFYTRSRVLKTVEADAATASVRTHVPVREIFNKQRRLEEEFGAEAIVGATLHTRVTYTYSTPAGRTRSGSLEVGGAIDRTEKLYRLPDDTRRETIRTGESGTTRSERASLANGIAILAGILAVVGLVVTKASVSRIDAEAVEAALQRRRFDEWVTEVESYTPQGNSHVVEVGSLGDLVDLAIDTGRRVLSPADMDEYLVVDDGTVFRYSPSSGTKSALQFGFSAFDTAPSEGPADLGATDEFAVEAGDGSDTSGEGPFGPTREDGDGESLFDAEPGENGDTEWFGSSPSEAGGAKPDENESEGNES
jgi:hypothetical protein